MARCATPDLSDDEQLPELLDNADADRDGKVSMSEVAAAATKGRH